MKKLRFPLLIAVVAGFGLFAAPASAVEFSNPAPVAVPDQGSASSPIQVAGQRGPVSKIVVTLHGVSHGRPVDLDVLLVSPDGVPIKLMSDACGMDEALNRTYVYANYAINPPSMPLDATCPTGIYRQTDWNRGATDDHWPGAPSSNYTNIGSYHGIDANGTWRLYVADDDLGRTGSITRGWSLDFETTPPDALLPGLATFGAADPYPMTSTVSGVDGVVTDVDVALRNVYHSRPDDLDAYLVGPGGQKVVLMSDACGDTDLERRNWTVSDEAAAFPDGGAGDVCPDASRFRPTDYEPGEDPPGGPAGPFATSLSEFDLTDPNGDWRLYVYDDAVGDDGWLADSDPNRTTPFRLLFTTRPRAEVGFTAADATVTEGETTELVVRRTGADALGAGRIAVTTAGTASAGDFAPVTTPLEFAAGQVERTIPVSAIADGEAEGDETLTVSLGQGTGDARAGTPQTATVTIRDLQRGDGGGGQPGADLDTAIDRGPKRKTTKRRAVFRFSSTAPGASYEYKLDRRGFKPSAAKRRLKRLRPGRHTLQVRAIDAAGNVDPTPAKRRWRIVRRAR